MFAYNPAVTDRSAEILSNANNQAAAIQLRGMESLGQSMANLGQTFSDSISKARENAAKADTNLGTAEALDSIYGTYGTPEQQQAFRNGLNKLSGNQDKTSGFLAMHVPQANSLVEFNMSMQRQQANIDGYKDLADYKASLSGATTAAPKYDFNYATEFNKALYDNGITDPEQRKQKFNEAGIGHLYDKFINPPKQNMGFFGPVTQ